MRLPTTKTIFPVFFLILCLLFQSSASANTSQATEEIQLSLLKKDGQLSLLIEMADGFKTYWQYPGNGGYAPKVNWKLDALPLVFPFPQRLSILGYESLGYKEKVILPIVLPLEKIEKQKRIVLDIDVPLCNEKICIPFRQKLTTPDITGIKNPPQSMATIASLAPPILSVDGQELSAFLRFDEIKNLDNVIISLASEPSLPPFSESMITLVKEPLKQQQIAHAKLTLPPSFRFQQLPDIHVLLQTNTTQSTVFFHRVALANLELPSAIVTNNILENSLWVTLLFAFLGGLLVNIMPCVIPLIGLKLGTNWQLDLPEKRRYFLFQSGGIFMSFAVLATVFIATSYLFEVPIWGRQLQSPFVVIFIGLFLTFFTILMVSPNALEPRIAAYFHHNTRLKPFVSGMIIPLIAAPCSAPFIATSLASALLAPSSIYAGLIFISLGCGIAFPSLLIALFYRVQIPLPSHKITRTIKTVVYALLATFVLWLVWLSSSIHSPLLALLFISTLVLITLLMLININAILRYFTITILASLLITSPVLLPSSQAQPNSFSENVIFHLLNRNVPVLVTISAEWCITCKVNDLVLDSAPAQQWLKKHQIYLLKGDWTLPDEAIENYLQKHHRYALPFTALYTPEQKDMPILLPEILTLDNLTSAYPENT